MNINDRLTNLYFHRLEVRFFSERNISMPFWPGAMWRNNFLHAASFVYDETGKSLFEIIDTLPINDGHSLYRQLKDGFPKGYLFDVSRLPANDGKLCLKRERVYRFSLILIGHLADSHELFVRALMKMFDFGIGDSMTSLHLVDIVERCGVWVKRGDSSEICPLYHPLGIRDFEMDKRCQGVLTIAFDTPTRLIDFDKVKGKTCGYQGRINGFPSFYQVVRSAVYRMLTLEALYVNPGLIVSEQELTSSVDDFMLAATEAQLLDADIRLYSCRSTPKEGYDSVYVMNGYVGRVVFENVYEIYAPIMYLASHLGIGNDINYGLGTISYKYE